MLRYRLNARPTRLLPLNVRSAGHYRLAAGQHEQREPGHFLQVFWSVTGGGRMKVGKTSLQIRPDMVFYYSAGEPHEFTAGPEGWDYRWLTFDGARHSRVTRTYGISRAQDAGPCPSVLFEQLDDALRDPTPDGELRASALGYEILLRACAPRTDASLPDTPADGAVAARAWLDAHFTDARLNVTLLAERMRLHRTSLHRLFTRRYGVPPVQYLGRLRLRLALDLLASTPLPIADVAVRCGLPDLSYFSKLISRHTGFSPRVYRQKHARTHLPYFLPAGAATEMSSGLAKSPDIS